MDDGLYLSRCVCVFECVCVCVCVCTSVEVRVYKKIQISRTLVCCYVLSVCRAG